MTRLVVQATDDATILGLPGRAQRIRICQNVMEEFGSALATDKRGSIYALLNAGGSSDYMHGMP